jgi:hypothetical protein
MPRPVPPDGRWIDRHRVVHFYASDDLIKWIEEEMRRTGMSKTQVIVGALDERRKAGSSPHRPVRRPRTDT